MSEMTFEERLAHGRMLRAEIKAMQAEQKALDIDLMAEILATGETKLKQEDGTWSVQNRQSEKLDKKRLILLGVNLDIIEEATTRSSSAPFLMWRGKDAEGD
jgi:hypothetical protein